MEREWRGRCWLGGSAGSTGMRPNGVRHEVDMTSSERDMKWTWHEVDMA